MGSCDSPVKTYCLKFSLTMSERPQPSLLLSALYEKCNMIKFKVGKKT